MELIRTIPAWAGYQHLVSGYTTRALGGLSTRSGPAEAINQRYQALARRLKIELPQLFTLPLTHSNNVAIVQDRGPLEKRDGRRTLRLTEKEVHAGNTYIGPAVSDPAWQRGVDGIIMTIPDAFAVILTADCAPVLFWDPVSRVCGAAHVGLVGAVNQLPARMVTLLQQEAGVTPDSLQVSILPSIRSCHYQLTRSGTWQRIKHAVSEVYGADNPSYRDGYFDLPGFIRWQLESAGVWPAHISDLGICTVCQAQDFFSHVQAGVTGSQEREGRFGSIIGVREANTGTMHEPQA